MKRIAFIGFCILAAALSVAAEKTPVEIDYVARIRELLPPKWEFKGIQANAVPYNLGIQSGQRRGTQIEVVGPTVVKGPRGTNDERESFQLWFMPADYTPAAPPTLAQFDEARLLGSNDAVAVYCKSFTSGTPAWRTWKEDIAKHLRLTKKPNQPPAPTR
jgi:hypothetical protein